MRVEIAIQARHFGPLLPPDEVGPTLARSKQQSVDVVLAKQLSSTTQTSLQGIRAEVTSSVDIEAIAWKKNFLWILVRFYATENQTISGWTIIREL